MTDYRRLPGSEQDRAKVIIVNGVTMSILIQDELYNILEIFMNDIN